MNRKLTITLAATLIIVAVVAGYVVVASAQENSNTTTTTPVSQTPTSQWIRFEGEKELRMKWFKSPLFQGIEVSPEYNTTVLNVLESNSETSQLLNQGYQVALIRPVIKAYISGNGDVTFKATQAIVELTNSTNTYVYSIDIANNSATLLAYYRITYNVSSCNCPCR